jgi:hypothetical protein
VTVTPDDFPGPREEEEVQLEEQSSDPTIAGALRYVAGSFRFKDSTGVFDPRSGGGGITEAQHEALDTLVHEIDETSYEEYTYSGSRVTDIIVWETSAKLKKIREENYTYSGNKVTQAVYKQYDGTGTLKMTVTETFNYSGSKVTHIDRVKS